MYFTGKTAKPSLKHTASDNNYIDSASSPKDPSYTNSKPTESDFDTSNISTKIQEQRGNDKPSADNSHSKLSSAESYTYDIINEKGNDYETLGASATYSNVDHHEYSNPTFKKSERTNEVMNNEHPGFQRLESVQSTASSNVYATMEGENHMPSETYMDMEGGTKRNISHVNQNNETGTYTNDNKETVIYTNC